MSGSKSKNKGKAGERELCSILEKYLGGNFERVPSSGAFIGGKNQHRREQMSTTQIRSSKSDIIPPDSLPNLVVESKWYKDFPFHAFVTNQSIPTLDSWLKDLEYDCDVNDFGILCVKINRKGWFICVKPNTNFILTNYAMYNNYIVLSLEVFLEQNKNEILKLSNK
jgi:hypothetical protein